MAHKRYFAVLGLCCVALFFAVCETSLAQSSSAGVDLFNGKDFTGWTFYMRSNSAPEKTWSITNGVIHCSGRPSGFMRTEKDYSNYKLTVEWRFLRVAPRSEER